MITEAINWKQKEAYAKTLNEAQLAWAVTDCLKARDAMAGHNPAKAGYYQDEASIYSTELRKRQKKVAK